LFKQELLFQKIKIISKKILEMDKNLLLELNEKIQMDDEIENQMIKMEVEEDDNLFFKKLLCIKFYFLSF